MLVWGLEFPRTGEAGGAKNSEIASGAEGLVDKSLKYVILEKKMWVLVCHR